ncbi:hypothetical protein PQR62_03785 [Herbaspirillum lusitanum]|uniref:Uncharacterized protein n=1 Tax=Herbaspirillum lusitanum TaxID=213312 RepID=A0ABW9A3A0_9BURK
MGFTINSFAVLAGMPARPQVMLMMKMRPVSDRYPRLPQPGQKLRAALMRSTPNQAEDQAEKR